MRKFLAVLFGLSLFIPLAACGGGDDDESSSDRTTTTADEDEETTTTEGDEETTTTDDDGGGDSDSDGGSNPDSDYCGVVDDAVNLDEFIDDDLDFTDPEALELIGNVLEELRDSVDDDDIADDYDTAIDGFEAIAEAFAVAGDDPDAQAEIFSDPEFNAQFEDFEAAGERIDEFTLEQCGQTLDGSSSADDSGSSSGSSDEEDTSLEDFSDDVDACEGGDLDACDTLFFETPSGSEAEAVALECGGEDPGGNHTGDCAETFG